MAERIPARPDGNDPHRPADATAGSPGRPGNPDRIDASSRLRPRDPDELKAAVTQSSDSESKWQKAGKAAAAVAATAIIGFQSWSGTVGDQSRQGSAEPVRDRSELTARAARPVAEVSAPDRSPDDAATAAQEAEKWRVEHFDESLTAIAEDKKKRDEEGEPGSLGKSPFA